MKKEVELSKQSKQDLPSSPNTKPNTQQQQIQYGTEPSESSSFACPQQQQIPASPPTSTTALSPPSERRKMFAVHHHQSPPDSHTNHEFRLPPISPSNSRSKSSFALPSSSSFDLRENAQDKNFSTHSRHYPYSSDIPSSSTEPQSMQIGSDKYGQKSGEHRNVQYSDNVPDWLKERERNAEYMRSQRSGEQNEGVRSGNRSSEDVKQRYDQQVRYESQGAREEDELESGRIHASHQETNNEQSRQGIITDESSINVKDEEPENKFQSVEGGVIRAVSMRDDREGGKRGNYDSSLKENRNSKLSMENMNDRETGTSENQTFSRSPFERNFPQPYLRHSTSYPDPTRSKPYASTTLRPLKYEFDRFIPNRINESRAQVDAMAANRDHEKGEDQKPPSDEKYGPSTSFPQIRQQEEHQAEDVERKSSSRLPSISSFQYDDNSSNTRSEGRNFPAINARPSTFARPPGLEAQGRTTSFLSSLMRAAGSPDLQSPTGMNSPMSVHTIVTGRSSSPLGSSERTSRKRRTSSVQEPSQGSAIESDFRAQSSPRFINQDDRHSFSRSHTISSGLTTHAHQRANEQSTDAQEPTPSQSGSWPYEYRARHTISQGVQSRSETHNSPPDWRQASSKHNIDIEGSKSFHGPQQSHFGSGKSPKHPHRQSTSQRSETGDEFYRAAENRVMYQENTHYSCTSGAASGLHDTAQGHYRHDENEYRAHSQIETSAPSFRHPSQHPVPPHQYSRGVSSSPYASNRAVSDSSGALYSRYRSSESPRSVHDTSRLHPYGGMLNVPMAASYAGQSRVHESAPLEDPIHHPMNVSDFSSSSRSTKAAQRQIPSSNPSGKYISNHPTSTPSNKSTQQTSSFESNHWNPELSSRAIIEQERWSQTPMHEKRRRVIQSVWDARRNVRSGLEYWPPLPSNVTTIRCMYANIAQKSYGSEKRFLCPPPVVKIDGPLRPCKWVSMRVISGDSPTPSVGMATAANNMYGLGVHGSGSGSSMISGSTIATGGEEPAILDSQGVARFGKLHVGSVSDATSKVFRLQVNLLRAETAGNEGTTSSRPSFQDIAGPLQLPFNAWSTFHSSPINVISKPARKSVRTRAASPAIASGSIVCLYNRLNSQTVRTKYLGIENGSIEDISNVEVARKLVARQDGWEGFSIELLARPVNDPAVARANARGLQSDEWGITYGSIVCLRDINSKLCSDPMLICKVDKGKVELANTLGNALSEGKVRFQITSRNREEARQILFGSTRGRFLEDPTSGRTNPSNASGLPSFSGMTGMRTEGSDSNSTDSPHFASGQKQYINRGSDVGAMRNVPGRPSAPSDTNNSVGGPVIQMQKVTLMHVVPLPSSYSADEVECDLQAPRSYLCSTVSENTRDEPSQLAIARSQRRLQSRSIAVRQGALRLPLDEIAPPVGSTGASASPGISTDSAVNESNATVTASALAEQAQSVQAQAAPVGFTRPPAVLYSATGGSQSGSVDVLEDQFCWTIVTISCTEVSYIEANAVSSALTTEDNSVLASSGSNEPSIKGKNVKGYPHLPLSPLPVTPFPCLAAQPSYDARSHSLAATIHDYLYADGLDNARSLLNTVSAVHAVPNKAAHEIWLGHSGPLRTHASSAGPHMSDVTVHLPNMEELMNLQIQYHSVNEDESVNQQEKIKGTNVIKLPLLFVRISQGITFPSGHWLIAEHIAHSHGVVDNSMRSRYDPFTWSFRIA